MFLLICGGIGVTPIQSVFNSLLDQHSRGRPLKKVWFLWSVRDTAMLDSDRGVLMHDKAYASALLPRLDLLIRWVEGLHTYSNLGLSECSIQHCSSFVVAGNQFQKALLNHV